MITFKENELRVYYWGRINPEMDEMVKEVVKKFGYKFWASGYDFTNNIRDLSFERENQSSNGQYYKVPKTTAGNI